LKPNIQTLRNVINPLLSRNSTNLDDFEKLKNSLKKYQDKLTEQLPLAGLFFKWIKQHLRIKAFYGNTENEVKTQIWIVITVYILVAIVKKRLKIEASLYTILQILSLTLFEKTPLDQLLKIWSYK